MSKENDVKIYNSGNEFVGKKFEAILQRKENGNFEKAKLLGIKLAYISPRSESAKGNDINISDYYDGEISRTLLFNLKVLIVFYVENIIKETIRPEYLSTMVINALRGELSARHPDIFTSIKDGMSFTLFTLAVTSSITLDEIKRNIASAFSIICKECGDSEKLSRLASDMWTKVNEIVANEIRETGFKD